MPARPVIIIGNLTIDDVIQPDGSSQVDLLGVAPAQGLLIAAACQRLTAGGRRSGRSVPTSRHEQLVGSVGTVQIPGEYPP